MRGKGAAKENTVTAPLLVSGLFVGIIVGSARKRRQ